MFLTTNNEIIVSLKSPPTMGFRSRIMLLFVSSELGYKTTLLYLSVRPRATVPSGHPQHLGVIVLTVSQKGMT